MDITTRAATAIALTVKQGLNFILDHFQDQQIFPSSISTKTTKGRQILVVSDKEALARFAQANFFDCRISTYPPNTYWEFFSKLKGSWDFIQEHQPNLIVMIGYDRS